MYFSTSLSDSESRFPSKQAVCYRGIEDHVAVAKPCIRKEAFGFDQLTEALRVHTVLERRCPYRMEPPDLDGFAEELVARSQGEGLQNVLGHDFPDGIEGFVGKSLAERHVELSEHGLRTVCRSALFGNMLALQRGHEVVQPGQAGLENFEAGFPGFVPVVILEEIHVDPLAEACDGADDLDSPACGEEWNRIQPGMFSATVKAPEEVDLEPGGRSAPCLRRKPVYLRDRVRGIADEVMKLPGRKIVPHLCEGDLVPRASPDGGKRPFIPPVACERGWKIGGGDVFLDAYRADADASAPDRGFGDLLPTELVHIARLQDSVVHELDKACPGKLGKPSDFGDVAVDDPLEDKSEISGKIASADEIPRREA